MVILDSEMMVKRIYELAESLRVVEANRRLLQSVSRMLCLFVHGQVAA